MKCIFFNHNSATPVVEINFPVTTCTAYKKLFFPLSSDSAISACGFFSLCATPSCYISVNIIAVSWICLHPKKDDDDDHICKGNHLYSGKSLQYSSSLLDAIVHSTYISVDDGLGYFVSFPTCLKGVGSCFTLVRHCAFIFSPLNSRNTRNTWTDTTEN